MNQSVKLLILQFFSIGLGFFSVFFVAANIPTKLYAVVGVYEIISGISRVFSNTGLETFAIRNVLLYKKKGKFDKISELVTQSLFLRIILASFLFFKKNLLIFFEYLLYISFFCLNCVGSTCSDKLLLSNWQWINPSKFAIEILLLLYLHI